MPISTVRMSAEKSASMNYSDDTKRLCGCSGVTLFRETDALQGFLDSCCSKRNERIPIVPSTSTAVNARECKGFTAGFPLKNREFNNTEHAGSFAATWRCAMRRNSALFQFRTGGPFC